MPLILPWFSTNRFPTPAFPIEAASPLIVPPDLLTMVAVSPARTLVSMPNVPPLDHAGIFDRRAAGRAGRDYRRRNTECGSKDVAGVGEIEIRHIGGGHADLGRADDAPVIHDGHVLGAGNIPNDNAFGADDAAVRLVDDGAVLRCLEVDAGVGIAEDVALVDQLAAVEVAARPPGQSPSRPGRRWR